MKIVEYNHSYASKVADMWNNSSSSWGGRETNDTEEDIIAKESKSGNIKLYLAIDNDEVVGYCSFSEFQYDTDTSYLPLLNVRPDYHSKGVGKLLVLKVLTDAIESEYNRFDLFTWAGNTKAIPLYKKCGFIWEKRPNNVHLMNFIPYMIKTDALKGYFEVLDYYKDNKRSLQIEYDGENIEDLTYYKYHFENENHLLKVDFERFGRGIRSIETNDYLIKMTTPSSKLIYGFEYQVQYEVVNKSNKPLNVEIEGYDEENIEFNFQDKFEVSEKIILNPSFRVKETTKEQVDTKTHPCVCSKIKINGKEALFKIGVNPIPPLTMNLVVTHDEHRLNHNYKAYLDIENGFNNDCEVVIKLKNTNVKFANENIILSLKKKEKKSIKLEYYLDDFEIYDNEIEYEVITDNKLNFTYRLQALFLGNSKIMHTCIKDRHYIVAGKNFVYLDEVHDEIFYGDSRGGESIPMTPKLGEPYSLEFSNIQPYKVEIKENNNAITLRGYYKSRDFKGVELIKVCTLKTSGLFEFHIELKNVNYGSNRISLSSNFYQNFRQSYLPYNGKVLKIGNNSPAGTDDFHTDLIDENWIYYDNGERSLGICFEDTKYQLGDYYLATTYKFDNFNQGDIVQTSKILVSNYHRNYHQFRKFSLAKQELKKRDLQSKVELMINEDNIFYDDDLELKVVNNSKTSSKGNLVFNDLKVEFEDINDCKVKIPYQNIKMVNKTVLDTKKRIITEEKLLLNKNGQIERNTFVEESLNCISVSNGPIEFKASSEFFDSIYSLKWKGTEILQTNFPKVKSKSWWSSWPGGIINDSMPMKLEQRLMEKQDCQFVTVSDNFKNDWQGIKLSTIVEKDKQFKGLEIETYVLTLPNIDLVVVINNMVQNTGKYINRAGFDLFCELNQSKNFHLIEDGEKQISYNLNDSIYNCNGNLQHLKVDNFNLYTYSPDSTFIYSSSEIMSVGTGDAFKIAAGETYQSDPMFMLFSEKEIPTKILKQLNQIKFEV